MVQTHLEEIVGFISVNIIQTRMEFNGVYFFLFYFFFVQALKNESYQISSIWHAYYTATVKSDTEKWRTGIWEKQLFYIEYRIFYILDLGV